MFAALSAKNLRRATQQEIAVRRELPVQLELEVAEEPVATEERRAELTLKAVAQVTRCLAEQAVCEGLVVLERPAAQAELPAL
jgi:hypothetical protein